MGEQEALSAEPRGLQTQLGVTLGRTEERSARPDNHPEGPQPSSGEDLAQERTILLRSHCEQMTALPNWPNSMADALCTTPQSLLQQPGPEATPSSEKRGKTQVCGGVPHTMVPVQPRSSQQPPLPLPKPSHKYTQCELGPQRWEVMACHPHPHHNPTSPHAP